MQRFANLFTDGPLKVLNNRFYDAKLLTEDGATFQVHGIQLAFKNIYFRTLFSKNWNHTDVVLIRGIDGDTMGHILCYLYTNRVNLDRDNAVDLWIASDYLLADSLQRLCRDFV